MADGSQVARAYLQAQVRLATYAQEFLQWVHGKRFRNPDTQNPDTQNRVQFQSLPGAEQKRIHTQWAQSKQKQEAQSEGHQPKVPPPASNANAQNLEIARQGKILKKDVLSKGGSEDEPGRNVSFKVIMSHNGQEQKFIFKPASGEDKDLRSSIPAGTYHAREQAAYNIDRLLGGRGIVPVTHTRGNDDGSYQVWSDGGREFQEDDMDDLGRKVKPEDLQKVPDFHRINLLDLIIGHEDRHAGNIKYQFEGEEKPENLRFIAIDNGLSLGSGDAHHAYVHPFDGFYDSARKKRDDLEQKLLALHRKKRTPEEDSEFYDLSDEALALTKKVGRDGIEAKAKGAKAVEQSLSNFPPDLVKHLKGLDVAQVAKEMTQSGIHTKSAVQAALVRIAALQQDPTIFKKFLKKGASSSSSSTDAEEDLRGAWVAFQDASGDQGDLLAQAGAEDRTKDIAQALKQAEPKDGWKTPPAPTEEEPEDMTDWVDLVLDDEEPEDKGSTTEEESQWGDLDLQPGTPLRIARRVQERWLRRMVTASTSKGRTLTIFSTSPDREPRLKGSFTMERNGHVIEIYKDERFRHEIQRGVHVAGKTHHPADGPAFMAAVAKVYGHRFGYDVERS